jgi:hypothetical protein
MLLLDENRSCSLVIIVVVVMVDKSDDCEVEEE